MLLIDDKVIYVHIPRTGGMFTRKTIYNTENLKYKSIANSHDPLSILDFDFSKYYTFGFVRNPWEWHLSYYIKLNLGGKTKVEFNRYIKSMSRHVSLQCMYNKQYCIDGELVLTEIFDTKNLEKTLHMLYDKFEWKKPQRLFDMAPVGTVIQRGKVKCEDFYTEETKEIVYNLNRDIIEKYDYKF